MGDVLMTNIFFTITGIAVIVLAVLLSLVLFHTLKIVRSVREIVEHVRAGAEVVSRDVHKLHSQLTSGRIIGRMIASIFETTEDIVDTVRETTKKATGRRSRRRKHRDDET